MPSAFRNWKTLPDWLQLDYFRRPRALRQWKWTLTWATLLVVTALSAAAWFVPGSTRWLQAGPVSNAHRTFNDDCGRCHTEKFQTARRIFGHGAFARSVPNEACVQCHDGPAHNVFQHEDLDCAKCHREHRGRAILAHVPSGDCTHCHADLVANSRRGDKTPFENVTGFPAGHPEFALWRHADPLMPEGKDPGQLRFNHHLHLTSELVRDPRDAKKPREEQRPLDCSACHQADPAGRYMLPVRYETHCASCHPLSVRLTGQFETPELREAASRFAAEPAPHRAPALVRAVLRDRLLNFVQEHPVLAGEDPLDLPFPKARRMQPVTSQQWNWAKRELNDLETVLFFNEQLPEAERGLFNLSGGCSYCHIEKPTPQPRPAGVLPEYRPTNLRERWLPHGRFHHESHRTLACTECHSARESKETSDVLMPRLDLCARCHHPKVGVRYDCVECHRYHDRATGYEPSKNWTIDELTR
jgi:predicted CXXCH cytochrome family protein